MKSQEAVKEAIITRLKTVYDPEIPVNEMDNPIPVGIIIDDSTVVRDNGLFMEATPVVGIIANTTRLDNTKIFIEYLTK